MEIEYRNCDRDSLLFKKNGKPRVPLEVIAAFDKQLQRLEAATNLTDLQNIRALRFKELHGDRKGEFSIRLNDQFRLILEIEKVDGQMKLVIRKVEDYH